MGGLESGVIGVMRTELFARDLIKKWKGIRMSRFHQSEDDSMGLKHETALQGTGRVVKKCA